MKICTKCKIEKEFFEFNKNKNLKSGFRSECKKCQSNNYKINKDTYLRRNKIWMLNNKEYRVEYKEKYRKNNKENIVEYQKHYHKNNKEYFNKLNSIWYINNKEYVSQRNKKYAKENLHKFKFYNNKRRAMKNNQLGEVYIDIERKLLLQQHGQCNYCYVSLYDKFHLDHWFPLSKGGLHDNNNLQLLCPSCNIKKRDNNPIKYEGINNIKLISYHCYRVYSPSHFILIKEYKGL